MESPAAVPGRVCQSVLTPVSRFFASDFVAGQCCITVLILEARILVFLFCSDARGMHIHFLGCIDAWGTRPRVLVLR